MKRTNQILIFDADDTLWENNLYFERVVDDFVAWLNHPTLDNAAIRAILADIQTANAATHGYGATMFIHSLGECFDRLSERPATAAERQQIDELAVALVDGRVELIPGVAETLAALGSEHDLILLTKGRVEDQQRKLDVSGLAHYFSSVHIVPEKDATVYRDLAAKLDLPLTSTWMIGNSPKSDIMPARAAGMNAVFIPNAHTWVLEHTELDRADTGVLHLKAFPELLDHFATHEGART